MAGDQAALAVHRGTGWRPSAGDRDRLFLQRRRRGTGRDSQIAWHSKTGNDWNARQLGARAQASATDQLYVVVQDASRSAVLPYGSTDIFTTGGYVPWTIPLSDITAQGVNVAAVKKMSIRVGSPSAQTAGGKGVVYVDDILVITPAPAGQ
jgi:hypothetical protein